jgi:putative oxidoreductase
MCGRIVFQMKIVTTISRLLLGLLFTVFGLNGFLHFISTPPPSGVAGQFFGALFVSNYLVPIFALQVISGILLLVNRFVPIALTILGPIIVNILLFHVLMKSSRLGARSSCRDPLGRRVRECQIGVRWNLSGARRNALRKEKS